MTNLLALATRLRGMPEDELLAVLRSREVPAAGISDFFDLAEYLLGFDSIQRALARLDRGSLGLVHTASHIVGTGEEPTLHAVADRLAALSDSPPPAAELERRTAAAADLLIIEADSGRIAPYDAVREALASWPGLDLPGEEELVGESPPASLDIVEYSPDEAAERLASERAFQTVAAIAELVSELTEQPARELTRGGLALPDTKRLAAAMSLDVDDVPAVVSIAERAGLILRESNAWLVSAASAAWLLDSSAVRWTRLAGTWLEALPTDVQGILGSRSRARWGDGLLAFVNWSYPTGGEWLSGRIHDVLRDAEVLGITADRNPSAPGSALLESGAAEAARLIGALFPTEVDHVYLQHDLSVVSPGPLAPAVDARLRSMADVESRALAATYRVSGASLTRALAAGESADGVLEFLRGISLTGIPQPLDYLVQDVAARYGTLRVGTVSGDDPTARSYVRSDDIQALSTVGVDSALSSIGLGQTDPNRLVSRFERDIVFWALTDARYPVAAEDADGRIVPLSRGRVGRIPIEAQGDPAETLLARLRSTSSRNPEETGSDWVVRQLDIAIRNRIALAVRVAMPNGLEFDYLLEPTGLAGGRLRARDRRADIERTLPLSSITSIGPADGAP